MAWWTNPERGPTSAELRQHVLEVEGAAAVAPSPEHVPVWSFNGAEVAQPAPGETLGEWAARVEGGA